MIAMAATARTVEMMRAFMTGSPSVKAQS